MVSLDVDPSATWQKPAESICAFFCLVLRKLCDTLCHRARILSWATFAFRVAVFPKFQLDVRTRREFASRARYTGRTFLFLDISLGTYKFPCLDESQLVPDRSRCYSGPFSIRKISASPLSLSLSPSLPSFFLRPSVAAAFKRHVTLGTPKISRTYVV